MLDNGALTLDREPIALLDDQTLAEIVGGEGAVEWFVKKIGTLLFDCIAGDLDNFIDAAKEGYQDGR